MRRGFLLAGGLILLAFLFGLSAGRAGAEPGKLDISIICNGGFLHEYGFQTDESCLKHATAVRDYLLTREPYKSRMSDITWHLTRSNSSLGCKFSGRLLTCSDSAGKAILANRGIPMEKGIILVNTTLYGGSGGYRFAVASVGSYRNKLAMHEFGHTLGALVDEYPRFSGTFTNQDTWYGQCWKGLNPPPGYAVGEWVLGAEYKQLWRQRIKDSAGTWRNSIMKERSYPVYGSKSLEMLNERIDHWVATP